MANDTAPDAQTTALLRTLVTALEEKKAEQLKVLHVGGISDITDFIVLATGNSEPHLRALRIEAEKVLDAAKVKIAGMEQGGFGSGWTVVDAYQIMVHFFTPEQRGNYALDKLWKDAPEVNLKTFVIGAAPVAAPKVEKAKAPKAKAAAKGKKPAAKAKPAAKGKVKAKSTVASLKAKKTAKAVSSAKTVAKAKPAKKKRPTA